MKWILHTGQSNTVGGDSQGGRFDVDPLVKVWNNASNRDDTTLLGSAYITPDRDAAPFFNSGNHQGVWAAHYLARATGEGIRLITSGRNGRSINNWHNGTTTGDQYTRMMAVLAATGLAGPVSLLIWNQGSADNGSAGAYRARWDAFVAKLTTDGVIDATTPIIVTETSWTNSPLINPVLQEIADDSPRIGYAAIGHYPTVDGTHFTGVSQMAAGYETIRALAETATWGEGLVNVQARALPTALGYSRKGA